MRLSSLTFPWPLPSSFLSFPFKLLDSLCSFPVHFLVPTHPSTVFIPITFQEVILSKSLMTMLLANMTDTSVLLWIDPSIARDTVESSFLLSTLVFPFYFDYPASPDLSLFSWIHRGLFLYWPIRYKLMFPGALGFTFFISQLSPFSLSNPVHFHGLYHHFIYWQHISFYF